jgi:type IV pilus assembly protein PilW
MKGYSKMKTNQQKGITIIEVMVALALSLIILAGVMHIFISNKQTYRVQEAFARLQESGRFATHFLTKDLRMAGYTGCGGKTLDVSNRADYYPNDNAPDIVGDFSGSGIEGFQTDDLPIALTNDTSLTASDVVPGTDVIRIKRADTTGARITHAVTPNSTDIKLDFSIADGMFQQYDILFISDCESAHVFVATSVTSPQPQFITITHAMTTNLPYSDATYNNTLHKHLYDDGSEIFKFENTTYYIGYNDADEPALFRQRLGNGDTMIKEELVQGVEDMQLLYGEDSNGDGTPDRYVESLIVGDWNDVVSVRLELGLRSVEDNLTTKETPEEDHRLRRTFATSIAIRNRVIN